jgi:predicted metal-dependent enzyme (double-stranded beta helix superfamily)
LVDMTSFDLERFVDDCRAAERDAAAVADLVRAAVARRGEVLAAIGPCGEQANHTLYASPTLTVQWISWAPGMRAPAHEHRMWAVIGVLAGREDNGNWRRAGDGLERSGGVAIEEGQVARLRDDVIHDVVNPRDAFTMALHVYGGDILTRPRSMWNPMTGAEMPFDTARTDVMVAAFNEKQRREPVPFAAANTERIMREVFVETMRAPR